MIVEDDNGQDIDLRSLDEAPEPSEPPDDDRPPLDLDRVSRDYHEALGEDMAGIPEHSAAALAVVPELVAELRAARDLLAEFESLPYLDEYAVYQQCTDDCEASRAWFHDPERTRAAAKRLAGEPQTRRIYTGPWVPLETSPF